jgi:nucleoid DNA-binding protein
MEITTLNKNEFVREVAKKNEWTLDNSLQAVNAVFEVISEQILNGNIVTINGVGKFEPKVRPAKTCIDLSQKDDNGNLLRDEQGNLITKEVPPTYSVKFRFFSNYKQKIKDVDVD